MGGMGGSSGSLGMAGHCSAVEDMPAACQMNTVNHWANWPVPNTHNYDVISDGEVSDPTTGLIWQREVAQRNDGTCSGPVLLRLDEATCYCNSLSVGNSTGGWRLPSRMELVSLLTYGADPMIDMTAFPNAPIGSYWSSSLESGGTGGWFVDFSSGGVTPRHNDTTAKYYVRCVRAGKSAPATHYTVGTDSLAGTVLDNATGLRWETAGHGPGSSSILATECVASTLASRSWRVPTINELLSIVDESTVVPAFDTTIFGGSPDDLYGSSTTSVDNDVESVNFGTGQSGDHLPTEQKYVRCVTTE
jgi:hypothetical protein